jgi:hypothetical protein
MSINIPTSHKIKIKIPHGELQTTIDWCQRNCSYDWRYTEDPNADFLSGGWIFCFESERDYVAFTLWKT